MFAGDRRWAVAAVLTLWATYAFVFYEMTVYVTDPEILYALAAAGSIVLLFNTASIVAMVQHYSNDKDHIYGLDIHYLDLLRGRG
jgi:hypothetical protein